MSGRSRLGARASGRREAAYGLAAYGAYLTVRGVVWNARGRARAHRNARRVIALERRVGLLVEPAVQRVASRTPVLLDVVSAGYAAGNVALSVGWLAWLRHRGDAGFRRERRAALITFLGALPVFLLFPTAPPRTQEGFDDTLADLGVNLDHPAVQRFYNPIAALPSHHVAFAVLTGLSFAERARSPAARAMGWSYAPVVSVVVVATGNHYVADVAAGAGLGLLARWTARVLDRS